MTSERSSRNAIYPVFKAKDFVDTKAYEVFRQSFPLKRKRGDRIAEGDYLLGRGQPRSLLVPEDGPVIACFRALFQGDHLGVEISCDSHGSLLEAHGLLCPGGRLRSSAAIEDDGVVQGLVIDDFFVVSREERSAQLNLEDTGSVRAFRHAKRIYEQQGIIGSDDKDEIGKLVAKVCGAQIDSSPGAVEKGIVSLGAPVEKRLALALLSVAVARFPYTTDTVHSSLIGSWISVMLLRRPTMCILNEVFRVIPAEALDTERPSLWRLPRKAADELLVASCVAPLMVSNLAVPFLDEIFATDASNAKGGITKATVPEEVAKALWRTADKNAPNLPLLRSSQSVVREHDLLHEEDEAFEGSFAKDGRTERGDEEVSRPIGLNFQFIEICGGSGVVTEWASKAGLVCGPVIDLAHSRQYNLAFPQVLSWVLFMLEEKRISGYLVSPPCTSFSPAAYPAVRSYEIPRGFNPALEKVRVGNKLAFASITLLHGGLRLNCFGLGEQPWRSKMRWLREWRALVKRGATEVKVASCAFGSPHQKEFCFVGVNMKVELLEARCTRDHVHIPIQGRFTRPSSVYAPLLAKRLACFFKAHIDAIEKAEIRHDLRASGLEDVVSNDILVSADWRIEASWPWTGRSHINVLEAEAVTKLFRILAKQGGDCRLTYFIDSHVAGSALCRGRSASFALQKVLKKACSLCLAFGLYPANRFAPTRINPADHPTRDTTIEDPVPLSLWKSFELDSPGPA